MGYNLYIIREYITKVNSPWENSWVPFALDPIYNSSI